MAFGQLYHHGIQLTEEGKMNHLQNILNSGGELSLTQ